MSYIQSIFFEFGSGCVLEDSGFVWQNRGASFLLDGQGPRTLAPGRKPFHTLNPALALFDDGRHVLRHDGRRRTTADAVGRLLALRMFGQGCRRRSRLRAGCSANGGENTDVETE